MIVLFKRHDTASCGRLRAFTSIGFFAKRPNHIFDVNESWARAPREFGEEEVARKEFMGI